MKIKKIQKSSKLQCVFCQGKGIQPGTERLSCIVCGGKGHVTVRQPYNVCRECAGTGKKAGATLYCLACQGKGFAEERKYIFYSLAKPRVSKTRKETRKKIKGGQSFLKGLLGTFKIL